MRKIPQPGFRKFIGKFLAAVEDSPHLETVVLYGSVARGDADNRSDVDLALLFDLPGNVERSPEFKHALERARRISEEMRAELGSLNRLELIGLSTRVLKKTDKSFVRNLLREGMILKGKPLKLKARDLDLVPKVVFSYELRGLKPSERVRVCQKLLGYVSKKKVGGKEFTYRYPGLITAHRATRIGKNALLADTDHARVFRDFFKINKIPFTEVQTWGPRE